MKSLFFCLLFFIFCAPLAGYEQDLTSMREKDFMVYSFKQQLALLIIKEKTDSTITIEEISLPKEDTINWHEWVKENAPKHTSWTLTKIDLTSKKVLSVFDVDTQKWLPIAASFQLLPTLLKLKLQPLNPEDRKYIGPQPLPGEVDLRPLWLPKVVFNGKELHPPMNVFRAYWPSDGSELSLKPFDLYFATKGAISYLPYWIEMHGPISKIKIMAIDSGTNLSTKTCRQF